MVSLFFILFLAVFVFFTVKLCKRLKKGYKSSDSVSCLYISMMTIFGTLTVIFFIWTVSLINMVGTGTTIDRKIAMYEKENREIVESIDKIESDIWKEKLIELYVENEQKIEEWKNKKINVSNAKFLLYFCSD